MTSSFFSITHRGCSSALFSVVYNGHLLFAGTQNMDSEVQLEYKRQREYLEKSVQLLKRQLTKETSVHAHGNRGLMEENMGLIKEINELRKVLNEVNHLLFATLYGHTSIQRKYGVFCVHTFLATHICFFAGFKNTLFMSSKKNINTNIESIIDISLSCLSHSCARQPARVSLAAP